MTQVNGNQSGPAGRMGRTVCYSAGMARYIFILAEVSRFVRGCFLPEEAAVVRAAAAEAPEDDVVSTSFLLIGRLWPDYFHALNREEFDVSLA